MKHKDGKEGDILTKLITVMKTVNLSLGKSEVSFKIIRGLILTED
jgi:hypothetical protein